jgi:tetratricopeptide (TPR) repeat protein
MQNDPQAIDARYRNGNALRVAGNVAAAEIELRAVLAASPSHRDAAYSLAFMLREQGRTDAAASVVSDWLSHAQPDADASLAAIGFLVECNAHAQARELANSAQQRWPSDARIAARAGEIALALGFFDDARVQLISAIDLDPNQSASWLRLSYCQRYRNESDSDIARFASIVDASKVSQTTRICAGFALGKALDDVGSIERAASILRTANSSARNVSPWSGKDWSAFVELRLRENISIGKAASSFSPIFVIGMPRTGTTLVSTLLGRHPHVRDRGELNWIPVIHSQIAEIGRLNNPEALNACARLIELQMRRDDAPARYYIDKNPLNFRFVDFSLAMFPNARFVHCRRERRDTALSIWMQHFAHDDLGFAYDFASISQVENDCRRFLVHWRERFSKSILDVDYENLVANPNAQLTRIAEFLGLDPTSLTQTPEASSDRPVTTASVWQARQPLYTRSVGRWHQYEPYVPELNG